MNKGNRKRTGEGKRISYQAPHHHIVYSEDNQSAAHSVGIRRPHGGGV